MLLLLAGTLVADVGLGFALGYMFLHPIRLPIQQTPADHGLRYEKVSVRSRDGTRLAGWFVPRRGAIGGGERAATVLLCHGYPANREEILDIIPPLHAAGFHVMAIDFRGLGESGGRMSTLGWREPEDVSAAVAWLRRRPEVDGERIGVLGWSMGAASCLIAAARDRGIRAVVADSAYARLAEMPRARFATLPAPFGGLLADTTRAWAETLGGFNADTVAPEREVGCIAPRPVLFIHGEADRLIPISHARRLVLAAGMPKEIWTLPGVGHVRAHAAGPAEYEVRIVRFFRRGLSPPAPAERYGSRSATGSVPTSTPSSTTGTRSSAPKSRLFR